MSSDHPLARWENILEKFSAPRIARQVVAKCLYISSSVEHRHWMSCLTNIAQHVAKLYAEPLHHAAMGRALLNAK